MLTLMKAKNITRNKECPFMIIKASMYQENITVLNAYVPYNRSSKYTRKNGQTGKKIGKPIISTLLLIVNRTGGQKSSRDMGQLHSTISQLDLFGVFRTLSQQQCNTYFSSGHGIVSKTDYVTFHKLE